MLTRATSSIAFALLLAVTQLGIAACPDVPSSLTPHATDAAVDTAPTDARLDAPANVGDVATVEPAPDEESGTIALATDEDGAKPVCDGVVGADAMVKRADAYFATDDKEGGLSCLEEAVSTEPTNEKARVSLVKRYLKMGDTRARVYAEELVRQKPLDTDAREMLGRAYMQAKMWNEAIVAFDLVVKAKPDDVWANNNEGFAALQVGKLDVAREHLERATSMKPQQGFMWNNLGVVYEKLGRTAEAHAAYARATELSPNYVVAALNRDRVQAKLTQDERIVSAETLLRMRAPKSDEPATHGVVEEKGVGGGDDDLERAVRAATSDPTAAMSGGARMAP